MLSTALRFITDQLSVGNKLQNIAFYSTLTLMLWVVIVQLKIKQHKLAKRKNTKNT
jgi:hypothetical protein